MLPHPLLENRGVMVSGIINTPKSTFSEYGHAVYQLKGMECTTAYMQIYYLNTRPGWGQKVKFIFLKVVTLYIKQRE